MRGVITPPTQNGISKTANTLGYRTLEQASLGKEMLVTLQSSHHIHHRLPSIGDEPGERVIKKKGAGGSRTHDGGFAIRCLSHLATAP